MNAVRIHNLTKTFKTRDDVIYALRGVDIDVSEGEMLLLVGPSGCGKTTLISVIAGILSYDDGACEVLGHDLSHLSARELLDFRAKNIGFIFQSFNLLPALSVAENVAVPLIINGMHRKAAIKQASDVLEMVGLGARVNDAPNSLSGGQQQRVAIARALVHKPRLIVCDEPTSALDHDTGGKIMEMLRSLNEQLKTTFVVVTHDNRIFEYATRIATMDDGKIIKIEEKR